MLEPIVRAGHQQKLIDKLHEYGQLYAKLGIEEAKTRAEYDRAKYSAVLEMRMQGENATNIRMTLKGRPDVNEPMERYLVLKTRREACLEVINITKLEIRLIDPDININ